VEERACDAAYIQHVAVEQAQAGSDALDVDCGPVDAQEKPATMEWLGNTVQTVTELPLCIDSPIRKREFPAQT
jgi:cobalamin-dependent methionine synthase I